MKVICQYNEQLRDDDIIPRLLTKGKIYDVMSLDRLYDDEISYVIICDDGVPRDCIDRRFITIDKWREDRLKIIGIND